MRVKMIVIIARGFFDDITSDQLREGFSDLLINQEMPAKEHVEIEKALLCLYHSGASYAYRPVGLSKIYALLGCESARSVLLRDYGIDDYWFQQRMAELEVLAPELVGGETAGALKTRIRALENERDVLLNSKSWRLTKPLRNLSQVGPLLQRAMGARA